MIKAVKTGRSPTKPFSFFTRALSSSLIIYPRSSFPKFTLPVTIFQVNWNTCHFFSAAIDHLSSVTEICRQTYKSSSCYHIFQLVKWSTFLQDSIEKTQAQSDEILLSENPRPCTHATRTIIGLILKSGYLSRRSISVFPSIHEHFPGNFRRLFRS